MTIYAWPTLSRSEPRMLDWSLQSNTQSFVSPLSGAIQTVEMPGARWHAAFGLSGLVEADAALIQAWFASLRGQSGRFYLHNFARPTPRGSAPGSPLVMGAGQVGSSLVTDGWTPGQAGILLAGDFFGVNGELKIVVADASSNGSGQSTIQFEPPLRSSPADNAVITTNKPTATFKLDEDTVRWVTSTGLFTDVNISATEAW